MAGRPRKEVDPEFLIQVIRKYSEADKAGKKEILKEIGMSQPTLWRRVYEAGIKKEVIFS